jgi:pimeloyl-ACP methyl ester carboxylesterase
MLGEYLYHITVADPSGEFAMNSLLEPVVSPDVMGVFARQPLESQLVQRLERITTTNDGSIGTQDATHNIAWSSTIPKLEEIKVLFGDHDWMRPNEPSARSTLQELRNINTSVCIVPNAGHHLYLDNGQEFVRHILN